ncbi:unnamed protein product, partial [Ectocarpus sp. 12 AP-2014]
MGDRLAANQAPSSSRITTAAEQAASSDLGQRRSAIAAPSSAGTEVEPRSTVANPVPSIPPQAATARRAMPPQLEGGGRGFANKEGVGVQDGDTVWVKR